MKRKVVALILVLVLFLGCAPIAFSAEETHVHRYEWDEKLQWYFCTCGTSFGRSLDLNQDEWQDTGDVVLLLRGIDGAYAGLSGSSMDINVNGKVNVFDAVYYLQLLNAETAVVSAVKTGSCGAADTVNVGERIVYTVFLKNTGNVGKTVDVTVPIPANTEYVGGADQIGDDGLAWSVALEAGEIKSISYTVKVPEDETLYDGGKISAEATVDGATVSCDDIYIERTLNAIDTPYVAKAIKALSDSSYSGMEYVKWVYQVAFTQNITSFMSGTAEELLGQIAAGENAAVLDAVAPTLYGGTEIKSAISGIKGDPGQQVKETDLVIGDVILAEKNGETVTYMYGDEGLVLLESGAALQDTAAVLKALPKCERYAVLRISAGLTNFTPSDPNEVPETLSEAQQALIATAEAYWMRGEKVQYADTRFANHKSVFSDTEFRWQTGINAPEASSLTDWKYTNCAAFTYDVYYHGLGYALPGDMYTTERLMNLSDGYGIRKFYFSRTVDQEHTEEEKAAVKAEFYAALQPGDIMVNRRESGGHAMLYVGNGKFIHSSGDVYNYSGSYGVEAYEPSIRYHRVEDYFFDPASTRYVFGDDVKELAIVRPLELFEGEIPENTQNRMENMQGIVAQKQSSHPASVTANPGEEITFTFTVYNSNNNAVTLDIQDTVPANAVYLSGAEQVSGSALSWTVELGAGERKQIFYQVKVAEDAAEDTLIQSAESTVGGVAVKCAAITVGRTLTAEEQAQLIAAYESVKAAGSELTGLALANEIYRQALGVEGIFQSTDLDVVTAGDEGVFADTGKTYSSKPIYQLNGSGQYADMLAPTLYGGRRLYTKSFTDRTRLAKKHNLIVGDVVIGRTNSAYAVMIYLGGDQFVSLTSGIKDDSITVDSRLERLLAYGYYYAVLRPSQIME